MSAMHMVIIIAIITSMIEIEATTGYYWKDYNGKVPEDAFQAGPDINNDPIYVGLVYLGEDGIVPTTIYPGKTVYVASAAVEESRNFVQILCGNDLRWIPANKSDFHFITMNEHLVRGGIQTGNWLHVGRVNQQGNLIVGKILSGRAAINDAFMNFVHNRAVKMAYSYEVLVFENSVKPV